MPATIDYWYIDCVLSAMVYRLWTMDNGLLSAMVYGLWSMDYGLVWSIHYRLFPYIYKPQTHRMEQPSQLKRSLGLGMVVVIVVSNIIGSGVYKKVAPMTAELHSSGWVLLCWVLGGIVTLFGALSNAEVAGLLADTGGDYVYYKTIYNKFFAFLYGWSLFTVIQTASIASLAYVFAQSLSSLLPVDTRIIAITLIVVLSWFNIIGIKSGALLSRAILIMVVTAILVIVIFGLSSGASHISRAVDFHTDNNAPVHFSSIFTAMLSAFWAYQGWATVGLIGGEVKDAKRNIPLGIAAGVFIVIAVYLLVNTTYLSLLTTPQLTAVAHNQNAIAAIEAVKIFWGKGGGLFLMLLIALTTLGCTHATILGSGRTYYAMALEGLFFKPVARLNKAKVPATSLFYKGVWACVLVLSGTFDQLTDMLIFAVFIYYGATALGVFILRKRMPDAPRPYKVWGYPVVPALFILFCMVLICNTLVARPREAGMGLLLILSGVPFYWWFRRRVE
jgi:APA family basic amino acid/polyamine antiporter